MEPRPECAGQKDFGRTLEFFDGSSKWPTGATYNLNPQKAQRFSLATVVTKTKKFSLLSSQLRSAKFVFSKMGNIIDTIDTLVSVLASAIARRFTSKR